MRQQKRSATTDAWSTLVRAPRDRKSTRLNLQSRENLVCRLLLEKKKIPVCVVPLALIFLDEAGGQDTKESWANVAAIYVSLCRVLVFLGLQRPPSSRWSTLLRP